MKSYLSILKIVLHGRSAGKILLATVFSFTFSIAVILCTFGLMDGFDHLLKSGLRHSSGDIIVTHRRGFFEFSSKLSKQLSAIRPVGVAPVIQTEAFAIHQETSKGVIVRGIEENNFKQATGLVVDTEENAIVIGEELSKHLNAKIGDEIALTFGSGNGGSSLPTIRSFRVNAIVEHGIYQKDLRFVYLKRSDLAQLLGLNNKINNVILSTANINEPLENLDRIKELQLKLRSKLEPDYIVRPFWSEYSFLIEAVKVEKISISLILQLIVVVAVFNIIAFVIYIMEKKAQEFFFLRAIGLSLSTMNRFWFISVIIIWAVSCLGAFLGSEIFNWCLQNLSFLQIPGEIYVLSSLSIRLDMMAYLTVYAVSLIWILAAVFIGYIRLKRRPIIQGLRQEFSA